MLIGAMIISYMLGEVTVLISDINRRMGFFLKSLNSVNTTMKNLRLPEALQLRITQEFFLSN